MLAENNPLDIWHAVDFERLDIAQHDLEQWWEHRCRGVAYDAKTCARCGFHGERCTAIR